MLSKVIELLLEVNGTDADKQRVRTSDAAELGEYESKRRITELEWDPMNFDDN